MSHRIVKRFDDLSRQGATGCVGDGARNHDRQAQFANEAARFKFFLNGEDRGLAIECVKNGFNEQYVGAAVDEPAGGIAVGVFHLIKIDGAESGVVHIRRQRECAIHWPQHAGHKSRAQRRGKRLRIGDFTRQFGPLKIQLISQRLHVIVGHGNGR